MRVPPNHTKKEVIDTLYRVARRLADRYRFSYHSFEDMVQEGVLEGIKGLENYKEGRPLENFLYIHIRNRLYNFKRNNYIRPDSDKPCFNCPLDAYVKSADHCTAYDNKDHCEPYYKWSRRNKIKQNIMDTLEYEQVNPDGESNMSYELEQAESIYGRALIDKLSAELPVEYLADFQRLLNGIHILKKQREELMEQIMKILYPPVESADGKEEN